MSRPTVAPYAVDRIAKLGIGDLAQWDYHTLSAALGCKDWFTAKVRTNGELEAAMQKADTADTASYIEIVGGKHDHPAGVKLFGSRLGVILVDTPAPL